MGGKCAYRRFTALAAILLLAQGCAVVSPIRKSDRAHPSGASVSLDEAINYANGLVGAYQAAMEEHAQFNVASAVVLIPLAVFAAVKSVTGANIDNAVSLAGGALGGYALASSLSGSKHANAYANGRKALNCAIAAIAPANIPAQDREDLNLAIGNLSRQRSDVVTRLETDTKATGFDRQKAVKLLDQYPEKLRAALATRNFLWNAGRRLVTITDNISARVDADILRATSDFHQYRSIALGVIPEGQRGPFEPTPAPAPTGPKPVGPGMAQGTPPAPTLAAAVRDLEATYVTIDAILNLVPVDEIKANLSSCLSSE